MQRRVQLCSTLTLMFFSSLTTRCLLSVYAHLIRMKDKLPWNKFASLSVSSPMLTHLFLSVFSLFSCAHSCLWVHGNVWDSRVGVLYLDAFLRYFFDWTARCLNKKNKEENFSQLSSLICFLLLYRWRASVLQDGAGAQPAPPGAQQAGSDLYGRGELASGVQMDPQHHRADPLFTGVQVRSNWLHLIDG